MYEYAHATIQEEFIQLNGFSSGDKAYALSRSFSGPKRGPKLFFQKMCTLSKDLGQEGSALI